jgi:hypothetical protein
MAALMPSSPNSSSRLSMHATMASTVGLWKFFERRYRLQNELKPQTRIRTKRSRPRTWKERLATSGLEVQRRLTTSMERNANGPTGICAKDVKTMKSLGHSRRRATTNSRLWREMCMPRRCRGRLQVCLGIHFVLHARSLQLPFSSPLSPASSFRHSIALSILEASCSLCASVLVISSLCLNQWSLLPGDSGFDSGLLDRAPDFLPH